MPVPPPINRQSSGPVPPPLRPVAQTPVSPSPSGPEGPRPPRKNHNIWLIIGLILIGLGVVAALVLFLVNKGKQGIHEYDDGLTHEKVLRENTELEVEEIPSVETEIRHIEPRVVSGKGTAGDSPITLDIDVDSEGRVTGTYWNVLYCLKFSVTGRQDADGNLNLTLHLEGVDVPLVLNTTDKMHYSGTLGSSEKYAEINLYSGHREYESPVSVGTEFSGHLSGNGMNKDFRMSLDYDGDGWFWFPDQGFANRMRVVGYGDDTLEICGFDGEKIATMYLYEDGSRLVDFSGKEFTITNLY